MLEKKPITVTDEERTGFRASYRFMSAMRGPDLPSYAYLTLDEERTQQYRFASTLKEILTGRFRALAYTDDECMGVYTPYQLTEDDLARLRKIPSPFTAWSGARHYLSHLEDALRVCEDHPIWGGHAAQILFCLERITRSLPHVTAL